MTIKKKFVQLGAAGVTFGLLFLCGLIAGASSFFLPAEKNWWLIAGTACLPMLLGMVAAVAAYFVADRMIKDDEDKAGSPPAAAPVFTEDEFGGLVINQPSAAAPVKRTYRHLYRWLIVGLGTILVLGLDALAFVVVGLGAWRLLAIEGLLVAGGAMVYFLALRIRGLTPKWWTEIGWPVISGLCVLIMVVFFVLAIGGPALGQTLAGWFGRILSGSPGVKIFGAVLGYVVWAAIAAGGLFLYNRSVGLFDGQPSKGWVAVTISLPILAIMAFFGFELIEIIAGSFAKSWILYAILAAVLTMILADRSKVWEAGVLGAIVVVLMFAAGWLISWAVLSAVGATYGMFGQGAAIISLVVSYGFYLSWERSKGGKQ